MSETAWIAAARHSHFHIIQWMWNANHHHHHHHVDYDEKGKNEVLAQKRSQLLKQTDALGMW